jgi:hypothetical protein
MMMTVGELGSDPALQEVGAEARARLSRVAESLQAS